MSMPSLQRKRPKDGQEAGKTREDKDNDGCAGGWGGGCQGVELWSSSQWQEMKSICQCCEAAGKNKR